MDTTPQMDKEEENKYVIQHTEYVIENIEKQNRGHSGR